MNEITINELKLYSPFQVTLGSFFGGPIAMVYFLWKNFKTLGKSDAARQTIIWGVVFNVVLLACLQFLPSNFPEIAIPFVYALVAMQMASSWHMDKEDIEVSATFNFQSNWRVLIYSLVFFITWIACTFPLTKVFTAFGVID
tara:strand:+ start:20646 stop:21071 length:426 start_codon:yes stop_codon:yes gene_type:complete